MIARMELWQLDDERVEVHSPRVLRSDENANRVILWLCLRESGLPTIKSMAMRWLSCWRVACLPGG